MFTINTDSLFRCQICNKVLQEPIVLPCGETVCRSHSLDINSLNCFSCRKSHPMPQNGYPFNQIVQSLLENKFHTLNLNSDKFKESKLKIDELNKRFREIELIQNDPEFYIDEYFIELIREIDLRREVLIESIQKESNKVIDSVNQWKSELVEKAKKENIKMIGSIEKDRLKLTELNSMFDSLEIDNKKMDLC